MLEGLYQPHRSSIFFCVRFLDILEEQTVIIVFPHLYDACQIFSDGTMPVDNHKYDSSHLL